MALPRHNPLHGGGYLLFEERRQEMLRQRSQYQAYVRERDRAVQEERRDRNGQAGQNSARGATEMPVGESIAAAPGLTGNLESVSRIEKESYHANLQSV